MFIVSTDVSMAMPSACPTVRIILRIPEAIPTFSGGISRIPELIAGPITSPKAKPVKHNRIITDVIELSYRMYPYKYVVIVKPSIPRPESQMPRVYQIAFQKVQR